MTNFLATRSMDFHQSGWFFRYQTDGIPSIWLIFQVPDRWNYSINLVIEILKRSAPLHFEYELGWTAFLDSRTPQQWISKRKNWKNNFQKNIFPYLKTDALWRITLKAYKYFSADNVVRSCIMTGGHFFNYNGDEGRGWDIWL